MGDFWADVRLAMIIFFFIYLMQWTIAGTGSKKIGIILAIILIYLTVWSHFNLLLFMFLIFFGYGAFAEWSMLWEPKKPV